MDGSRNVAQSKHSREITAAMPTRAASRLGLHPDNGIRVDSAPGLEGDTMLLREAQYREATWARRAVDIVVSLAALAVLSPLLIIITAAIMFDSSGGPLYRQWRTGYLGKRFRMIKFRTMVHNADELRDRLRHRSHLSGPDFKIVNDPRVTRVGRLIRRSSLDELPQLLNVLKGEMTLVGPRPTSFSKEDYEPWQLRRLTVKPGLTGLWQISGRSNVDFADRVRLDLRYIDERSLLLDLLIILKTPWAVLRGDGAS
jgi:lipopolysaccharide/colanic/teichoic acid biosynthesis glycosyltransferase